MANYSKQREAMLTELRSRHDHPTAAQVYDSVRRVLPNISLGTVYRNLAKLAQNGDILKLDIISDKERFDGFTARHAHFVCNECKAVLDADIPETYNIREETEQSLGCSIESLSLTFYGVCDECKKSEKEVV